MVEKYNAKIVEIKELSSTVKHFVIDLGSKIDFKAGQFVNLSFTDNEKVYRKPYSIASPPMMNDKIELCIKNVDNGNLTPVLFEKQVGFEVGIMGPLGLFNLDKSRKEKLVFIGTGTGISPLRSMIYDLIAKGTQKEMILIFGVKFKEEILYKDEFESLEKASPNFKFVPIVSRSEDWVGRRGHAQDNLDVVDVLNSEVYMCGLPNMVDGTKEKLIELGMDKDDIHFEKF